MRQNKSPFKTLIKPSIKFLNYHVKDSRQGESQFLL